MPRPGFAEVQLRRDGWPGDLLVPWAIEPGRAANGIRGAVSVR